MTLFAIGDGNFDLYKVDGSDYLRSVPKYNNGCIESVFGSIEWFMRQRDRRPEIYKAHYQLV